MVDILPVPAVTWTILFGSVFILNLFPQLLYFVFLCNFFFFCKLFKNKLSYHQLRLLWLTCVENVILKVSWNSKIFYCSSWVTKCHIMRRKSFCYVIITTCLWFCSTWRYYVINTLKVIPLKENFNMCESSHQLYSNKEFWRFWKFPR